MNEVVDLVTGLTPPGALLDVLSGDAIPLIRPGDLDRPGLISSARDSVSELGARHGRLLPAGSVLVSCIGLLGKVGLLQRPAITNQQITALVPRPGIAPHYLFYWAQTLRPWLYQNASATTLPIINKSRLGRAPFPLAAPAEQRRIVTTLQLAEAHHQRAAAELAAVPTLLTNLRRSLLTAALHGELGARSRAHRPPVADPPIVPLGRVARVQVGHAFRSEWYVEKGVRLLRGVNVTPGAVSWTQAVHLAAPAAARYDAYALQAGDVVIGLDRPVISSGIRVARLTPADLPALLVQRVGRLIPRAADAELDPDYMLLGLQSDATIEHLTSHATGTQLPHISASTLESVPLPLPPLATQRAIVQHAAAAWQRVATADAQHTAATAQLAELWQALLSRAFPPHPRPRRPLWTP